MTGPSEFVRRYGSLTLLLLLVGGGAAVLVTSCGSGGGSPNGDLCDQCGDSPDGPCQPSVSTADLSNDQIQRLCADQTTACPPTDLALACLRKLGSAQRRCFPADDRFSDFECDGARANRPTATLTPTVTATPAETPTTTSTSSSSASPGASASATATTGASVTPAATVTPGATTATPAPTATPSAALCGNGVLDEGEECDGSIIDNTSCLEDVCTCEDFCNDVGGTLSCNPNCTVNFSACTAGGCSF